MHNIIIIIIYIWAKLMRIRRLICGHSYRCGTDAACLPFHFHQLYSITTSYAAYSVYWHIATPYSDLKSNKTSASYIYSCRIRLLVSRCMYGIVCDRMGSYGIVWDRMGSYGIVWDRMGSYGIVWDRMGSYGIVWDRMGSYGIVSAKRERFCFCLFSFKISNFVIF